MRLWALERRDGVTDFIRGHDAAGIVGEIDMQRGMHLPVRVFRRRVSYHRDLVAELGGVANGRFDAGMRDEADNDELMDSVLLQ